MSNNTSKPSQLADATVDAQQSVFQFKKFLMFGDSITEFAFNEFPQTETSLMFTLGAALSNAYVRRLDVLQRGYSGYNSEQARTLLPQILKYEHDTKPKAEQIALGYIFFGTNDSITKGSQHVPLDRYIENMRFLINEYKKRDIKCICFSSAVYDLVVARVIYPENYAKGIFRTNELSLQYGQALQKVCEEENVAFMDLYDLFSKKGGIDLLTDSVHFNGKGYKVVFEELLATIEKWYPQYLPENLEYRFPVYSDPLIEEKIASLH